MIASPDTPEDAAQNAGLAGTSRAARAPQQARGQQRVDAILDACGRLLCAQGEAALTMHGLAREARTSIGSLYHFFPDKQSVLKALGDRHLGVVRTIFERIEPISDAAWAGFSSAQVVRHLLCPFLDYFVGHPDFLHLTHATPDTDHRELKARMLGLMERVIAVRLPGASELARQAYAVTLFSLPFGMIKEMLLESDEALREPILTGEMPRALQAYLEAFEAANGR
ncbi:TetR/AcrR family transcriptional regulator [Stutzerimonas nosocomialis]|uniref:TetR/AcrR family transcriptional regulator n=1 Tax=Stutzerimonas nosocomialis TaxID=1056496 RepID=A0A5R9QJ02_9GAMM|nr:TetR/AcrR family transcriptional regulator [Stutzerimonas nosocomialis]TLX57125.1 TetR/AcrR family transcriptional regulator [Stutzerimonas nosocomialis]TLX58132.1 TetR/AcrR family transcriptional regulator [Stutzerimonas nosocomialis]TLX65251.1 TetR/AcrR family transcriptional regulator [Stutzerimonas nosocomialis]